MLFKQRLFSWFDSYDIYAQDGSTLFTVRGELSWGHCLRIYTRDGRYAGTVREKILTFLPRFELFAGENSIGFLKREFTLFRPAYVLEANGWRITGNFMQWDYTVTEPSGQNKQAAIQFYRYICHRCAKPGKRAFGAYDGACNRCGEMLARLICACFLMIPLL